MPPASSCTRPTCSPIPSPASLSLPMAALLLFLGLPSPRKPGPFPSLPPLGASLSTWLIRDRTRFPPLHLVRVGCHPQPQDPPFRWDAALYLLPLTFPDRKSTRLNSS